MTEAVLSTRTVGSGGGDLTIDDTPESVRALIERRSARRPAPSFAQDHPALGPHPTD